MSCTSIRCRSARNDSGLSNGERLKKWNTRGSGSFKIYGVYEAGIVDQLEVGQMSVRALEGKGARVAVFLRKNVTGPVWEACPDPALVSASSRSSPSATIINSNVIDIRHL